MSARFPQKCNVLVVEDDTLIRFAISDVLDAAGYRVWDAANVLEAIAIIGLQAIDAIFTDVDMPGGLNGLDFAWMTHSTNPRTHIIVTSGGHDLTRDQLPPGSLFVPKPYQEQQVLSALEEMTSKGRPVCQEDASRAG